MRYVCSPRNLVQHIILKVFGAAGDQLTRYMYTLGSSMTGSGLDKGEVVTLLDMARQEVSWGNVCWSPGWCCCSFWRWQDRRWGVLIALFKIQDTEDWDNIWPGQPCSQPHPDGEERGQRKGGSILKWNAWVATWCPRPPCMGGLWRMTKMKTTCLPLPFRLEEMTLQKGEKRKKVKVMQTGKRKWEWCTHRQNAQARRRQRQTATADKRDGRRTHWALIRREPIFKVALYMLSSPTTNAIRQGYQGGPEWSKYSSFHQMISLIFP